MKHFILAGIVTLLSFSVQGQKDSDVLMHVADNPVTVEEFRYIYEKNNGKSADYSKNSVQEYLDLYTKFKLKVAKAKQLKMDTIPTLMEELNGYKRQLANSYLMDKEVLSFLQKQLYDRTEKDVSISHIYVKTDKKNSPTTNNAAKAKIEEALAKLKAGESWDSIVKQYSEDKTSIDKSGSIGFFTVMMPNGFYEFENTMYSTPKGEYSDIISSRIGYHIVKVDEVRPARGKVSVAHVLLKKSNTKAQSMIQDIYQKLQAGESWDDLVKKYSEDDKTKNIKGVLPEFGINTYESSFEDAAFGLMKDGDISKPVQSQIGYHILKRINKTERPDFNTFKKIYEPKIKKDERYQIARKNLIEDIKKAANFTKNEELYMSFARTLDQSFLTYKWSEVVDINAMKPLVTFGGNTHYSLKDFIAFCKKNTRTRLKYDKTSTTPQEVADILFEMYVDEKAIDYEQSNLEIKYKDFRSLMREYEEGILLFEVTKDAVWDRANEDTIGLEAFYQKNKNNYMTEDQADLQMVFINTTDTEKLNKVVKYINKKGVKKAIKKYNKKEELISTFDEKLERSNKQFKTLNWEKGAKSEPQFDKTANRYSFKRILETYPPSVKALKDARGYIVADYQDHLEREWIKALKNEFSVKLNENILQKLIK